jgi:4-carboxymuconolactone decarboxylase
LVRQFTDAGICGVRFNFLSHLGSPPKAGDLDAIIKLVRPFGWHIAVHVSGSGLVQYRDFISIWPVRLRTTSISSTPSSISLPRSSCAIVFSWKTRSSSTNLDDFPAVESTSRGNNLRRDNMVRLKPIDPNELDGSERAVYDSIASTRGSVGGPFLALLHSPNLASKVEQLGAYTRYKCLVPERLRELAILVVARHWRADFEWFAHAPLAEKQGVPVAALRKLGLGETPDWSDAGDAIVYEFCRMLLRDGRVDDETYASASQLLGTPGVVDLVGLVGYYCLIALTLNAHEVAVPADAEIPWHGQIRD